LSQKAKYRLRSLKQGTTVFWATGWVISAVVPLVLIGNSGNRLLLAQEPTCVFFVLESAGLLCMEEATGALSAQEASGGAVSEETEARSENSAKEDAVHSMPAEAEASESAETTDPVVQMVTELLQDPDRDMRALGLQQIREGVGGPDATQVFVRLLPKLSPEMQAGVIEALGSRKDKSARAAILERLESSFTPVRVASLRALSELGEAEDVPRIARYLAAAEAPELQAAKECLSRLPARGTDEQLAKLLPETSDEVAAAILEILTARNARQLMPMILPLARGQSPRVRMAALSSIRQLGDQSVISSLIEIAGAAPAGPERWVAQLALETVCAREPERALPLVLEAWPKADSHTQILLLHALARIGGLPALGKIVEATQSPEPDVATEAKRLLCLWPDAEAIAAMRSLAERDDSLRTRALVIRGFVRLASSLNEQKEAALLLQEAWQLAQRPEERRLVLAGIARVADPSLLPLVTEALQDANVREEAASALLSLAPNVPKIELGETLRKFRPAAESIRSPWIKEKLDALLSESWSNR